MAFTPGLNAPTGIVFEDDGSVSRSISRRFLDGSTLSRSTYSGIYNAVKLKYGKECGFNASSSNIATMTNNTTPSGYTASANSEANGAAYLAMAGGANQFTGGTYGAGYWELDFPSQYIYGAELPAYSGYTYGYLQFYYNSKWQTFAGLSEITGTAKYFDSPVLATKARINWSDRAAAIGYIQFQTSFFGADLTKIKCVSHGYSNGDDVTVYNESGTLPSGLTEGTTYYVNAIDSDNIKLYDTYAHAIAGGSTGLISLSDAGLGSFKIWRATTFPLGNVADTYISY